jgi:hypothetical protein
MKTCNPFSCRPEAGPPVTEAGPSRGARPLTRAARDRRWWARPWCSRRSATRASRRVCSSAPATPSTGRAPRPARRERAVSSRAAPGSSCAGSKARPKRAHPRGPIRRSDPNVSLIVWSAVCLCGAASSLLLYLSQARARLGFPCALRPAPCALRPARFILRPAPGPASGPRAERARARAFAGGLARFLAAAGECGGPGWLRPRVLFMTLGMTFPKDSVPWFGCAAHSQWVCSSSCSSSIKIGAPAAAAPAAAR